MTTLFGIKNCDTIKKARNWLRDQGIEFEFHDVRTDGINAETIEHWVDQAGWETVLNRRGTTWRKLDTSTQENTNRDNVIALLLEHPAMIKRPVLDVDGVITIGFKADLYQSIFNL
ncbi:MAG: ArsC family reductase [Porticoccaceae bacterium]|nr:ArsC family reductase [Porticoccaceae bacterium]MDG1311825.1 ArsC family reductase [Porticoccaceae bacterium]